jgi:putative peptidoglycan lipid II flippase
MSENERMTRAAFIVSGATLVSRILGFLRDMATAYFLGAGMAADAFFVAFRIPNLLRRLLAEGSLTIAFVPVFTEYLSQKGRDEAFVMARAMFTALTLSLLFITLLGEIFSPFIVHVMAPGFADDPHKYRLTVDLTRMVFPYIFFVSLVAICMGVLNSMHHFAAPALSPALLNVCMISSLYLWGRSWSQPVYALAVGVLIGGAVQLALQIPYMRSMGFSFRPSLYFSHPGIKKVMVLMGPSALGAAVYQLNILVGTLLASLLPAGSVSYLYYADRVVELPLGIFAIALGTAALPSMSRHTADGDMAGLVNTFSHALRLVFFDTLPAMTGLIMLRQPIVEIFQRGAFDAVSTQKTSVALLYYALGLWAFSSLRILTSAFSALQDTKTPVKVAALSLAANFVLSIALLGPLQHGGLALATSLAAALQAVVLVIILRKRLGRIDGRNILFSLMKTTSCSMVMALTIWIGPAIFTPKSKIIFLALYIGMGMLVYLAMAKLLKCEELQHLAGIFRMRRKNAVAVAAELQSK